VETQGPLAVIWVASGLIAFYIALLWINALLGLFLTPLFMIPLTWLQDRVKKRKARKALKR
jgi:predicted Na+-dependent transporter